MKCIVLAGGNGNRLWPLCRKSYPKQFMKVHNGISLLQETIERNKQLCDEFIIMTNIEYRFIIEDQLSKIENIKYTILYETERRNTAAAIALACLHCNVNETLFIVSSDHVISRVDYKESVYEAEKLAENNNIVIFGIEPYECNTGYGYIQYEGNEVISFTEKPDYKKAKEYISNGNYLWNSGMFLFKARVFLKELKEYRSDIYYACEKATEKREEYERIVYPKEVMRNIPSESIDYAVLEKAANVKVIQSEFKWCDVGNLEALDKYLGSEFRKNIISNNSKNSTIINNSNRKLVVTNDISDILVVNTNDSIYISQKSSSQNIKKIIEENTEFSEFFKENSIKYRPWGYYEILNINENYIVKKVTIHPKNKISLHKHKYRSEHWVILNGTVYITLNGVKKEYHKNESIYVQINELHMIENNTDSEISIIETSIGSDLSEDDIIRT